MKEWTEKAFWDHTEWYHATTQRNVVKILKNGILNNVNRRWATDFGYGFYLTPSLEWDIKYLRDNFGEDTNSPEDGRIIKCYFRPSAYLAAPHKFFADLDDKFAIFIIHNRTHANKLLPPNLYSMVGGPMADGNLKVIFSLYEEGLCSWQELKQDILNPVEDWQLAIRSQFLCGKVKIVGILNGKGEVLENIN